jgi:hypothetical protein
VDSSKDRKIARDYLRNKITLKYSLTKQVSPYLSGELWYQLNNVSGNEFDSVRYTFGINYDLNKSGAFGFFYLIENEFNVNHPGAQYVFGVIYSYSL